MDYYENALPAFDNLPGPAGDLRRVLPLTPPDPPPAEAGWGGVVLALGGAVLPVALVGGMIGAHLATYTDKQADWARLGALAGTGLAATLLLVAYVKQR